MTNLVILFVCLATGMVLQATKRLPENAHATINGFIINTALPALILARIHDLRIYGALILPVLMPWLLFALGLLTFLGVARRLHFRNLQPAPSSSPPAFVTPHS